MIGVSLLGATGSIGASTLAVLRQHRDTFRLVAVAARAAGTTRAVASMDKACGIEGPLIVAVGNAPTALLRLAELMDAGKIAPALVVGVPVGFVNVVEAKEELLARRASAIVARGRKGGSTVAAAIMNALLYQITRPGGPK